MGVDPAHDHLVVLTGQKFSHPGFQGRDGRGTGRIHDIVGPPDSQVPRYAGGLDVQQNPVDRVIPFVFPFQMRLKAVPDSGFLVI